MEGMAGVRGSRAPTQNLEETGKPLLLSDHSTAALVACRDQRREALPAKTTCLVSTTLSSKPMANTMLWGKKGKSQKRVDLRTPVQQAQEERWCRHRKTAGGDPKGVQGQQAWLQAWKCTLGRQEQEGGDSFPGACRLGGQRPPARAELPALEAAALARVGPTPFPTFWDLWGRGSGRSPETPWTGPPPVFWTQWASQMH